MPGSHRALSWKRLRAATPARIGLPRAGVTISTREHLSFQLDHARARDAVHEPLDVEVLLGGLELRSLQSVILKSAVADRYTYLVRPDLGRRLDDQSRRRLGGLEQGY